MSSGCRYEENCRKAFFVVAFEMHCFQGLTIVDLTDMNAYGYSKSVVTKTSLDIHTMEHDEQKLNSFWMSNISLLRPTCHGLV